MTDQLPAARPVPSTEDRMRDARTDTTDRSFAAYLTATDRDQLDARAAAAEQERDEALDARDVLRVQLDAANADVTRLKRHLVSEQERLRGHIAQARDERDEIAAKHADAHRLAAFRKGVIDRHRQELGAAGEVLAVVRDAAERIERALAVYDTTPGEGPDCPACRDTGLALVGQQFNGRPVYANCPECGIGAEREDAAPPSSVPPRRAQEGDRIEDGGVMGTLVRCRECGGGGLLHRPDVMPAALQPQEATEPASSCPETVWDGPYAMRCGQGALGGVCATHGRFRPVEARP